MAFKKTPIGSSTDRLDYDQIVWQELAKIGNFKISGELGQYVRSLSHLEHLLRPYHDEFFFKRRAEARQRYEKLINKLPLEDRKKGTNSKAFAGYEWQHQDELLDNIIILIHNSGLMPIRRVDSAIIGSWKTNEKTEKMEWAGEWKIER
tara:strand:+ start:1046 stop:1492 length:447 start_codon:yes stop_codon:yes gene_type:complete